VGFRFQNGSECERESARGDGYGKVRKKGLLEPVVVPVQVGKVEIERETAMDAGNKTGWDLENLAVELRGSGKRGWRGSVGYLGMHSLHMRVFGVCGFMGVRRGK
jgi:hypothetical protein